jgi:hypothetical protein
VLDGLRGEHSIAELCRREGIAESLYYTWSKSSWRLAGQRSFIAPDCSQTMALPTSRPTSPNGWTHAIWVTARRALLSREPEQFHPG